ncbi:MAG: YgfZ/GcvT domain-containing protein [Comamonas sp.]
MTQTLQGIAPISHLGVIRVQGEDAASFLHGQLTNDFALLDMQHARLAAFCNAKGRMQASFIGFKRAQDDILLLLSKDLLAQTLKRLSMFVLRAKAKLSDATDQFQILGIVGTELLQADTPAWSLEQRDDAHWVQLYPVAGQARSLWVAEANVAAPQGPKLSADAWRWTEVASGIATLSAPVFELFVPQMLNYESVGGVNFKKGCYPGQEVVARSQFRGTLKRRGYLVESARAMHAGQEIFAADDAEQATGTVVQAAPAPTGGWQAIISMQTSSSDQALTLDGPQGAAVRLLSLPYPLLDDI